MSPESLIAAGISASVACVTVWMVVVWQVVKMQYQFAKNDRYLTRMELDELRSRVRFLERQALGLPCDDDECA